MLPEFSPGIFLGRDLLGIHFHIDSALNCFAGVPAADRNSDEERKLIPEVGRGTITCAMPPQGEEDR